MAKFRDLSQPGNEVDIAIGDRLRHVELVKELAKSDLPSLLEELDIFKADNERFLGNVQKISLKMAKEFRFVYEEPGNPRGAGQKAGVQEGAIVGKAGDVPKDGNPANKTGATQGGREPGRIILEVSPEEIDDILDEAAKDLNLPYLSPKSLRRITSSSQVRWRGLKENGIEPRLDLEASYIEKLKREKMLSVRTEGKEKKRKSAFTSDDLRYHGLFTKPYPQTNVLIVIIMDKSGSMNKNKKYFAKAFCYALYNFVKTKYQNAEIVFIIHDVKAQEVDSADVFFRISSDGGTAISSGPLEAVRIIRARFDPQYCDIYCVHCSDGENNYDDSIEKVITAFRELVVLSTMVGFLEIKPDGKDTSLISDRLAESIKSERFKTLFITKKEDVRKSFDEYLRAGEVA